MNIDFVDELRNKFGSQFDLVVAAAKRAGQIRDGNPPLVETDARNPLTIALQEIAAGKILLKPLSEELKEEPEPTVQDYLTRRGSLQDQLGGSPEAEDEEDLEGEEEEADLPLADEELAPDSDSEDETAAEPEDLLGLGPEAEEE